MTAPAEKMQPRKGHSRTGDSTRRANSLLEPISALRTAAVDPKTAEQAPVLQVSEAFCERKELYFFLQQAVTAIVKQLAAAGVYLCLHNQREDLLRLEAFCHPTGGARNPAISLSQTVKPGSLWRKLVRQPTPLLIRHAANDPRVPFHHLLSAHSSRPLLVLPLANGNEVVGFIGVMVQNAISCTQEKIDLATVLAQPAALAAKMARTINRAQRVAVLQERSRIARDLHDTLAQISAGVLVQINLAEEVFLSEPWECQRHLERARTLTLDWVADAHRFVRALGPLPLENRGLVNALGQLADRLTSDTGTRFTFSLHGTAPVLSAQMEAELFRIAQEATANVVKHACACTAEIELTADFHSVRLSVQDAGSGLNGRPHEETDGFGFKSMKERARLLGGNLIVSSQPAGGTCVQVTVPRAGKALANSA